MSSKKTLNNNPFDYPIEIALYEPENHSNIGAIIRTSACCKTPLSIIEPLAFNFSDEKLNRAKLDYHTPIRRFLSFDEFLASQTDRIKILLTPHSSVSLYDLKLDKNKKYTLVFGRESNGVEPEIAAHMDILATLPMEPNTRSLNLANSASICLNYIYSTKDLT